MDNNLTVKDEDVFSLVESHDINDIIKPLKRDIHLFDTFIAGTTHLKDTKILDAIKVGDILSYREVSSSDVSHAIEININQSTDHGDIKYQKIHFVKGS